MCAIRIEYALVELGTTCICAEYTAAVPSIHINSVCDVAVQDAVVERRAAVNEHDTSAIVGVAVLERQSIDHSAVVSAAIAGEAASCTFAVDDRVLGSVDAEDRDAMGRQRDDAVACTGVRAGHDADGHAVVGPVDGALDRRELAIVRVVDPVDDEFHLAGFDTGAELVGVEEADAVLGKYVVGAGLTGAAGAVAGIRQALVGDVVSAAVDEVSVDLLAVIAGGVAADRAVLQDGIR